jgi:hypothetical protein
MILMSQLRVLKIIYQFNLVRVKLSVSLGLSVFVAKKAANETSFFFRVKI